MKIVLASRNEKKKAELQVLFSKYIENVEILSLNDVGIYGEIEENGTTFEENALIKASAAAKSGYIGVGDDSGLEVKSLGGQPGVYSARYAGEHGDDDANNALLIKNLQGIEDREAKFVCAIACVFPGHDKKDIVVRGEVKGEIIDSPRGGNGFGYDPYFYYPPFKKTLAEATPEEKNSVSHRGRAIALLVDELKRVLN